MKSISFVPVPKNQLLPTLLVTIKRTYKLFSKCEETLIKFIDQFSDELVFLIEYPYVDKLYRDSFYRYYSTKHNLYIRDSIRVSIFSPPFDIKMFSNSDGKKSLKESFLGFFTIRPVAPQIIGRTIFSPKALKNQDFVCCLVKLNVFINGIKFEVSSFPYTSQNRETISCAEVSLWEVMEYFGSKYSEYKVVLPSNINRTLEDTTFQRQTPSNGLSSMQISRALKEYGLSTMLHTSDSLPRGELKSILDHYLLSGIPVIATIRNVDGKFRHAVVLIDHTVIDDNKFSWNLIKEENISTISTKNSNIELVDYSKLIEGYVIMDDNRPPYEIIEFDNPTPNYKDPRANLTSIFSIIVPLYQKVYLEARKAEKLFISLLNYLDFGLFGTKFIYKLFYSSSRSFKEGISDNETLNEIVKKIILLTTMPRFIWVILL